ncbi:MAG TPA: type II secretion system protein, partial [Methylomirabilota bacterium]|nr:type II secretion system protein [Methylomirabilota bacterium]
MNIHWLQQNSNPVPGVAGAFRRAFTLVELLVVIAIMAILAGLIVGLVSVAGKKSKLSRVETELNQIVTAIEGYRTKLGFLPPMNGDTNNFAVNPLYYELKGTVVTDAERVFAVAGTGQRIGQQQIRSYFRQDGFANAVQRLSGAGADSPAQATPPDFLQTLKSTQVRALSENPEVLLLAVPVDWPLDRTDQPTSVPGLNPWR